MVLRVFQLEELLEDGIINEPAAGFVLGAFLRLHQEEDDVSERGSAARREAIGGQSVEELAENVVDVDLGDVIAGGAA